MYSPDDLPSSTRAAPAKNRIWSTIGGISSDMVRETGLPVFSLSIATSSSAFSSITSASLSSARCRSLGVDQRHFSNAVAGGLEGLVDVVRVGVRRGRVDLARGRVDDVHHRARRGGLDLAVDDVVEDLLLRHVHPPSYVDPGSPNLGRLAAASTARPTSACRLVAAWHSAKTLLERPADAGEAAWRSIRSNRSTRTSSGRPPRSSAGTRR